MNDNRAVAGGKPFCCRHPDQDLVGVCSLCLKEKLLILNSMLQESDRRHFRRKKKKITVSIPSFSSISSFLHLFAGHRRKPAAAVQASGYSGDASCNLSLEDSFISIKLEDDGHVTWDREKLFATKAFVEIDGTTGKTNVTSIEEGDGGRRVISSVIEHGKHRSMLRWRQRIWYIFQLATLRRSRGERKCHVGYEVEAVEKRKKI
ncbi:hypothetical protein AXF42_Ash018790 [Apostasia shenzhenica]|uniref:Uncharacterized protein n=1 Tax=Apostasia shenzhenica TaxID=1088818 RepID=A0A2I0B129_9ASPA|nr:hypothetical protein AXF42_Ash018790 [Apostasia shenzhenica]